MTDKNLIQAKPGLPERFVCEQPDREQCIVLARELQVPYPLAVLLWLRGVRDYGQGNAYLKPQLADLPSPFLMKDMDRAVALVLLALRENWPLCIHGDYDVDGITGTALLARFFRMLERETVCYQPDRLTEGYGLQPEFIRANAPAQGLPALLITVDCGIADVNEVQLAKDLGFMVIVTDHHLPGDALPPADALLNPHQQGCRFPYSELAGVGVAFFLTCAIRNRLIDEGILSREKAPNLKNLMDLVALGTVADVMPLTGINRILVKAGLEIMNQPNCTWARALNKQLNSFYTTLFTSEDISYKFAPRINAPGRLGKPELSFQLLSITDPDSCDKIAAQIERINQDRRELEGETLGQVLVECERQEDSGAAAFVVYGSFHQGIIGIIASRVVDRFNKPVIIFTDDLSRPGTMKGSGRTVQSVNLHEVLQTCSDSIIQFGGHAMAAGLSIDKEKLALFTRQFETTVAELKIKEECGAVMSIDYYTKPEEVLNKTFIEHYKNMQPFGNGNSEPVFMLHNAEFIKVRTVKNHLTFALRSNGREYRGIGFGMAEKIKFVQNGPVRLAFKLKNTVYRGEHATELHVVDIMKTD